MSRAPGQRTGTGMPTRVLDVLETDGGWLTADGIALALGTHPNSVRRALYRLKNDGEVERRQTQLATKAYGKRAATYSGNGQSGFLDVRAEWRLK